MNRDHILDQVLELIRYELSPARSQQPIQPHHHLRDDLGLDSLRLVGLTVALEDTFDLIFDPLTLDLVQIFASADSLTDFIIQAKAATPAYDQ